MRRALIVLGACFVIATSIAAQTARAPKPVQVCVASAECFGPWCAQRNIKFPEHELVAKKLSASPGATKIEARDEGYRERSGCAVSQQTPECDYLVLVKPVETNRSLPITRSQREAERLSPAQAPNQEIQSPNAQVADERQQEPLDQSSITFKVIRFKDCQLVESKELKRLEGSNGAPDATSLEWLTSKAVERIRVAIEKDLKISACRP